MSTDKDYDDAAQWAEHEMILNPASTTALHGPDAAAHGQLALARAMGGRPKLDPTTPTGQYAPARQVRLPTAVNSALDQVAAQQHRKPSAVMRDAISAYVEQALVERPAN